MARRTVSNPLALAVLVSLWERPMHPYEISTTLRERNKEGSIKLNYGSLYSVVDALLRNGFIAANASTREGRRPERTVYTITDSGVREMADWLTALVGTPVKEYPQFEAALSLIAALPPDLVIDLLEQRADTLRAQLESAKELRAELPADFPDLFLIESEYAAVMTRAEIGYIDDLVDRLRTGGIRGVEVWRRMHELRSRGRNPEQLRRAIRREFPEEARWYDDPA
jgi:DNA-binding PadR family transcriptional regulator